MRFEMQGVTADVQDDGELSLTLTVARVGMLGSITSARLNDYVCVYLRDASTPDGDYSLKLVIYDGGAREVYRAVSVITAKDGKWGRKFYYGFNEQRDLPGAWWYVVELDDVPLLSKELVVSVPDVG